MAAPRRAARTLRHLGRGLGPACLPLPRARCADRRRGRASRSVCSPCGRRFEVQRRDPGAAPRRGDSARARTGPEPRARADPRADRQGGHQGLRLGHHRRADRVERPARPVTRRPSCGSACIPVGHRPSSTREGEQTGENLGDRFDVEAIPLLVKLLAAARPLSVQVHPPAEIAAAGWQAQQESAARRRVLSDPFEKTEMLVALGHFEAFAGWRPTARGSGDPRWPRGHRDRGRPACGAGDIDAADPLAARVGDAGGGGRAGRRRGGRRAARAAGGGLPHRRGAVSRTMPARSSRHCSAFLRLEAGQAVYVPAGVPHSYIRGTGLEVMTSSDNVIRLGLTSKPVFVERALEALVPGLRAAVHGHRARRPHLAGERAVRRAHAGLGSRAHPRGRLPDPAADRGLGPRRSRSSPRSRCDPARPPCCRPTTSTATSRRDGLVAIVQSTQR